MDTKELRRQRAKFGLKYYPNDFDMKKALFLLVKHQVTVFFAVLTILLTRQEHYQKEADQLMERRILKANKRAEYRARNRERRRRSLEKKQSLRVSSKPSKMTL